MIRKNMFSFNKKEKCRDDAKQTVSIVMFGAFVYAMFLIHYDYEDGIVHYSSNQRSYMDKSFVQILQNYFTSIYHMTASIKCIPAFLAIIQVCRMNARARGQVKIRSRAANKYAFFIIAGMILCAGGDYCLDIDSAKDDVVVHDFLQAFGIPVPPFILGLVSFLLGHIAFIFAFHYDGGNSWRLPVAFCLYAYAAGMVYIIFTFGHVQEGDNVLRIGIIAYSLVIATMCRQSISLAMDAYPGLESTFYAVVGSLTFLVSDTVLAYNRFVAPVPFGRVIVLTTYFLSLGFIASSASGITRWKIGWD